MFGGAGEAGPLGDLAAEDQEMIVGCRGTLAHGRAAPVRRRCLGGRKIAIKIGDDAGVGTVANPSAHQKGRLSFGLFGRVFCGFVAELRGRGIELDDGEVRDLIRRNILILQPPEMVQFWPF